MKTLFILLCFLAIIPFGKAQFTITLEDVPPYYTPLVDLLYFSGDLNAWGLQDNDFAFSPNMDGTYSLTLNNGTEGATYEFKVNRGDWANVETNLDGSFLPNRSFTYTNGGSETITVWNWEDMLGWHTAVGNTHIMDLSFYIPQLMRSRRVWIYLPQDYYSSNNDYPVLYMHDAQNLFDEVYTPFGTEWGIDESMEQLQNDGHPAAIVVGIDHGDSERINEYSPWNNPTYGGGDGDLYADFLTNTLKPFIDNYFRTKPAREHTAILGSSMGGLISYFAGLNRQDVFSKVGVFSPSFWFSDEVNTFGDNLTKQGNMRVYFLAGEQESTSMVPNMQTAYNKLLSAGFMNDELNFQTRSDGQHSEWFWAREFYDAFVWLFQETPVSLSNESISELKFYPNPVKDQLFFEQEVEQVKIFSMDGQVVLSINNPIQQIELSQLPAACYLLQCQQGGNVLQNRIVKLK